ncbi:proline/glycine betaine ABC transporter permease [Phytoactinopolyspora limicola]|uniref:ABC transporter permease n=1 Tax=Phytoactinopolyspora limicola TaxID=2715536 RepID=UPI0031B64D09
MRTDSFDPLDPRIDLGDWIEDAIRWFVRTFSIIFDGLQAVLEGAFDAVDTVLEAPHFLIMITLFAALAWTVRSWKLAVFTVIGFYVIASVDQWSEAMYTLAMVLVAAGIAVLISVPVGIWAAKSTSVSNAVRPILDFMQTMPPLVYLVPAIVAFGVGVTGGIVATIVFAMPPGVRFTELAIRQVDSEVVEAGQAFGSTPRRILRQIQLPLAMPTIMAGINQVIMLALSMVVLTAFIGAHGLGREVRSSLTRVDLALGVEGGLAIVILAIYLDRVVAALADRAPVVRASRVRD